MTFSRLCLLGLFLAATVSSPVRAQECEEGAAGTLIREGRKALSFSFDGFDLGYFEGGIGGKYWLGPRTALRASVSGDLDFEEGENRENASEHSRLGAGVRAGVERHFGDWQRVSPFVGFVAGVNASRSRRELGRAGSEGGPHRVKQETARVSGAADAVLGVEYFFMPHVSMAGEYAVGARLGRAQQEEELFFPGGNIERSEDGTTFFDFASRSPTLILSVYF